MRKISLDSLKKTLDELDFRLQRVKDGWKFDPVAAKAAGI
jgi:hypothetical protein